MTACSMTDPAAALAVSGLDGFIQEIGRRAYPAAAGRSDSEIERAVNRSTRMPADQ